MFVTSAPPSDGAKFSEEAAEIERFRARHRRMCRGQQQNASTTSTTEALDVDGGRTRKISAKWRQKQLHRNQIEDGAWPQSAGTEMHLCFNAFDFSSSPEAFYEEEPVETTSEPVEEEEKRRLHMAEVAKQVTAMGFNSASLWEQSFPGLRQLFASCRLSGRIP
ncbi:hypothetical protein L917_09256 [Phytophthora nicotianae]|uniref:Uncharacterized protein n=2 Tax=Phytophthora nicotianae TaxID=4792 RepID=W2L6H8_PHYNI|nr:hypothetical protein L917_09256 [Phytophthora nicotianae]ETO74605.1 hypothetical protein F444_09690 [Phytophthora nicotianae P1976]